MMVMAVIAVRSVNMAVIMIMVAVRTMDMAFDLEMIVCGRFEGAHRRLAWFSTC